MKPPASTVRFTLVVQKSGRPEQITLWQSPDKNPRLRQALKQDRVMTIKQHTVGTKKDFGIVGFDTSSPALFLIFPKSLKRFFGKKIIGLNYTLLSH